MAKRIVTKIGDVFCVEVDNEYKCFFQYVANDMTVLNSSVIRVFKEHYPIDYKPNLDEIVRGFMPILFSDLEYYIVHGIRLGDMMILEIPKKSVLDGLKK